MSSLRQAGTLGIHPHRAAVLRLPRAEPIVYIYMLSHTALQCTQAYFSPKSQEHFREEHTKCKLI